MLQHGFRHLLVIDGDHEVGILSIRDLMAGVLGCTRPGPQPGGLRHRRGLLA